jgi:hypothetical protein
LRYNSLFCLKESLDFAVNIIGMIVHGAYISMSSLEIIAGQMVSQSILVTVSRTGWNAAQPA